MNIKRNNLFDLINNLDVDKIINIRDAAQKTIFMAMLIECQKTIYDIDPDIFKKPFIEKEAITILPEGYYLKISINNLHSKSPIELELHEIKNLHSKLGDYLKYLNYNS